MLQLSNSEKQLLLDVARSVVGDCLGTPGCATLASAEGALAERRGVFVSLHLAGRLRGCIGRVASEVSLLTATAECAVGAAFEDPRFPPLDGGEFERVRFEVSVLSPLSEIGSAEAIEVGRHGLFLEKDGRRGLLLPQVASAAGWNDVEFLCQTAVKAGLDPGEWTSGARIFVFETVAFREGLL